MRISDINKKKFKTKRVKSFNNYGKIKAYFDYASTTPVDPQVVKAMLPYFCKKFGNTMSLHSLGQEAKLILENAREKIANLINAKPSNIVFTSSATESNNLALKGIAFANRKRGNHIIISSIEHSCVMESAKWLESQGFKVSKISVDKFGFVNPNDVEKAIRKETILVSIIHASNEIGTIQPIKEIGEICKKKNVYFHTDAAQSFLKIPIDVNDMNIDLLTSSSHKIYGPKGAAFLFIKDGVLIEPLIHGGGHENGLRSSTVNISAIIGFQKACEIAFKNMDNDSKRIARLRDRLIEEILKIKGSHLNGFPKKGLYNIASFWFEGVDGEAIVIRCDLLGIAVSTGSACSSIKVEPSYALLATGLKPKEANGSLRISLGRWTTEKEINYLLTVLPKIIEELRKVSYSFSK